MTEDMKTTRQDHLIWCKKRALEYVEINDLNQAFASMASDLRKHKETAEHIGIELGFTLLMNNHLNTPREMRKFIEGFNQKATVMLMQLTMHYTTNAQAHRVCVELQALDLSPIQAGTVVTVMRADTDPTQWTAVIHVLMRYLG